MGFLDKKTRVLDFVLTERGREKLSAGNLNIQYYSFSDDGVDYRTELSGSVQLSGSMAIDQAKIYTLTKEPLVGDLSIKYLIFDSDSNIKPVIKISTDNVDITQRSKKIDINKLKTLALRGIDGIINFIRSDEEE